MFRLIAHAQSGISKGLPSVFLLDKKDADNSANKFQLQANTCSWRQARENACEQVTIGFGFTFDWLRKWREIFLANQEAKQSNTKASARLLSTLNQPL